MPGAGVKKGDRVAVTAGKEKGKRGKILRMFPKNDRVVVEGLNLVKRAVRPTKKNPQGGMITKEGSVHVSNVMLVCPNCDKSVRIGHRVTGEGNKIRVCRGCGTDIDKG